MIVYRHDRIGSIIVADATHAVFMAHHRSSTEKDQIADALSHLNNRSSRCFTFNKELTEIAETGYKPPTTLTQKPNTTFKEPDADFSHK